MLTCKEATRLVSEARDRKLGVPERAGLWLHLLVCKFCRRYARQLQSLALLARPGPDQTLPGAGAQLEATARERIRARLNSH